MAFASLTDLAEYVAGQLSEDVYAWRIEHDQLIVEARRGAIVDILLKLRDDANTQFQQLVDVCGVDYPERPERFEVNYQLLSLKHNTRIRVKLTAEEDTPVPSVVSVYPSAGWYERETYDMFGIVFEGHPDPSRILMPEDWIGHPLRKDYEVGRIPVQFKEANA